jgi:hypothetical protein
MYLHLHEFIGFRECSQAQFRPQTNVLEQVRVWPQPHTVHAIRLLTDTRPTNQMKPTASEELLQEIARPKLVFPICGFMQTMREPLSQRLFAFFPLKQQETGYRPGQPTHEVTLHCCFPAALGAFAYPKNPQR